ncbi:MAG: nucleoside transporter C-terminal domain-containing protein [Planctomycetota bacterium]
MSGDLLLRLQSLLGLVVLLGALYGFGLLYNRRRLGRWFKVPWRVVLLGIGLQIVFAVLILRTGPGAWVFERLNDVVLLLLSASREGASLLFGGMATGQNVPVGEPLNPGNPLFSPLIADTQTPTFAAVGAFFAFNILPTIIFFSALLAILYHSGLMTYVVGGLAWLMRRTMGTSGAETLSASANVFVGQTEAPLFVRPFLLRMTQSELMAVMVGGFSNIASGVLGVYAGMLAAVELGAFAIPNAGSHLLAASVISAPAGLVCAKLLWPETEEPETSGKSSVALEQSDANLLDAAVRGTRDGLLLAANVGAVLIVFTGFVWLANAGIGYLGLLTGRDDLTLQLLLGWLLAPVAWLCGVPWADATEVGSLIGIKTVLNEFFGYLQLSQGLAAANAGETYISQRSALIALYAICGFANFASVGIQIGGIGVLAPGRRADLAKLGLVAMLGGAVASLLTACVVGVLV